MSNIALMIANPQEIRTKVQNARISSQLNLINVASPLRMVIINMQLEIRDQLQENLGKQNDTL